MTNKNLMEGTVTRNMMGRKTNNRRHSNATGQEVVSRESMVIQAPVAQVDYNVNTTTAPPVMQSRPLLVSESGVTDEKETLAGETIPNTEDSRTQQKDVTVMQTRPMEVKKGISEEQKNMILFVGVIFISVGAIALLSKYTAK